MRGVYALLAAGVLLLGTAIAQQYPNQQSYPEPQTYPQQQPYPDQQSYPVQQGYPNQPTYPNQQSYPNQNYPNQQYPAYPQSQVNSYNTQIPAGTQLDIRTNENITADESSVGREYSAEISKDVMGPNGQLLIPRASPATLTVQDISSGSMGVGSNQVALGLKAVSINGRSYLVQTDTAKASGNRGIGANRRTAEMTGGGALLGTLIGAVAGGGKGAAIGAVVGAAGGATAQVLTRGKEVKVPAETVLSFKLDQPVMLH